MTFDESITKRSRLGIHDTQPSNKIKPITLITRYDNLTRDGFCLIGAWKEEDRTNK